MKDIGTHLVLFAVVGLAIVTLSAVFAEPADAPAVRSLPRRLVWFFVGCGVVAGILLALEHTVASVR